MSRLILLAVLLSTLTTPPILNAQTKQHEKRSEMLVDSWQHRLAEADQMLEQGRWKKAKRTANRVLDEMCDRIQSGSGIDHLLASAVVIRAVAEAGLGDQESAHWDYMAAQTLEAEYSRMSFEKYGPSASSFEDWRVGSEENPWGKDEIPNVSRLSGEIQPPERVHSPAPKYPFGKRFGCIEGPIQIQAVINEQGYLTWPKLLTTQDPVLGFAAIEALRDWRFKPAHVDGKPVRVFFKVVINFSLQSCEPGSLL